MMTLLPGSSERCWRGAVWTQPNKRTSTHGAMGYSASTMTRYKTSISTASTSRAVDQSQVETAINSVKLNFFIL